MTIQNIYYLNLSENNIDSIPPDFKNIVASSIRLYNNQFTFKDLKNTPDNAEIFPQKIIKIDKEIILLSSIPYTYQLHFDQNIKTNTYNC